MSAQVEVVEAQPRPDSSRGKNEARRLRVSGRVPAVVYGAKQNTVAVSVDPKQIKLDWEKVRESQKDRATRDVRASLLLDKIIQSITSQFEVEEVQADE